LEVDLVGGLIRFVNCVEVRHKCATGARKVRRINTSPLGGN
jgi:hypothetical protein